MKQASYLLIFLFIVAIQNSNAQTNNLTTEKYTAHNKGKFYFYWGGNRAHYSKSDITFKGENYNFTLQNVSAHDRPKGMHVDYINPVRMTIPQTNFRLGYFLTDKYNISFGVDHMKYVMTQFQNTTISGEIKIPDSPFNGNYNNSPIVITPDFLSFEHTDGLNFINVELSRVDDIGKYLFNWDSDKIQINLTEGLGLGALYPKTNTSLLGNKRYDEFHVSGYGLSAKAGLNITFLKYFFIQSELKGGYINMQDIRTTQSPLDSASQDFLFLQTNLVIGGIFRI
jgi:hypothetical protein